jgi:DNA-binding MarR family transcriptional regulator
VEPARHDDTAELAARLRMSIARMARFLRQQDQGELPPGQTSALATIVQLGPMTLGDVAARERIAPPSVTKAVEQLVSRGLVARRVDPTDRRVVLVEATADGRRLLEANRARRNEWLAHQLEQLDTAEVAQLGALLDVLEHLVEVATSEDLVR